MTHPYEIKQVGWNGYCVISTAKVEPYNQVSALYDGADGKQQCEDWIKNAVERNSKEHVVYLGNGYFAIEPKDGERLSIWMYGKTRDESKATVFSNKKKAFDFIGKHFNVPVESPDVAYPRLKGSDAPLPY